PPVSCDNPPIQRLLPPVFRSRWNKPGAATVVMDASRSRHRSQPMSIILQFSAVALKGFGGEAASDGMQALVGLLRKRFADNSKILNAALERSANRAWRAAELALAGSSWWDRCKAALSTAEQRAFRDQIQAFLKAQPLDGLDHGPDFRGTC